ncbi:hypothetical protein AMEX_G17302 [Astyanax mexicanus]|uniref:Uncharacterized protein n=1 Tax=Astyanax mexicanus TaxID=7994 RepID=A0A8T2L8Q1_ASTMX|nr:hypothetical protein AMEX_G17302 [Astyanax mexicanus]
MLKLTRTGLWDREFGNPQETCPAGEITVIGILLLVMSSLFVCLEHQLTRKTFTPISQKLIPLYYPSIVQSLQVMLLIG